MELVRPTCRLRPFAPGDAGSIARHANDRDVWLNLRDLFPHPYTPAHAEAYIAHFGPQDPPTAFAIVVGGADGAAVGSVSLRPGHDVERLSAEVGYWLGRAYWGRGIVTDAVRGVTGYALHVLGMHRVFAVPFAPNAASHRVLEKAGYAREGVMRRSAVKDGKVLDQVLYAACDDRWRP